MFMEKKESKSKNFNRKSFNPVETMKHNRKEISSNVAKELGLSVNLVDSLYAEFWSFLRKELSSLKFHEYPFTQMNKNYPG